MDTDIDDGTIRHLVIEGAIGEATTLTIRKYGAEILRWLARVCLNQEDARDAFSIFLESVWQRLARFRWESSLKTWVYWLARASSARVLRRRCGEEFLDESNVAMHDCSRSVTAPWLRTEVKVNFRRLQQGLTQSERLLLSLRVEGRMDWLDIAQATSLVDCERSDPELRRRAASLRKQFERLKLRLRTLGVAEGLIPAEQIPTRGV